MKTIFKSVGIIAVILLNSCQNSSTTNKGTESEIASNQFIGSWVQPNPINNMEVQGFVLNKDGTAQSINMETLKYLKWWIESNKLVLISESIGNQVSSIDTSKYDVVVINERELKVKKGDYIDEYKRK